MNFGADLGEISARFSALLSSVHNDNNVLYVLYMVDRFAYVGAFLLVSHPRY